MRLLCLIVEHLLCISVIGAKEEHAVHLLNCFNGSAYACIDTLHSLDSRFENTCMSYHVGICEVDNYNIVLSGSDGCIKLLAYFRCAHLRLQIVSSYSG